MSVILKDSNNTVIYTFPTGIELTEEPFTKRLDTTERALAHGSVITSDSKITTRMVSLHGIFKKDTQSAMETELRNMRSACYTENLRLYSTQFVDDFYKVECSNFESSFLGMLTAVEVNIDFLAIDPFRYYKDETTDDETVDSSPHSYTVTNEGDVEVSPVITFTAGTGASITKIKIQNTTDSDKYFEYEPASALVSGDKVVVDCRNAYCKLNDADDITHFSGCFFNLLSGDNSIVVTITGTVGDNELKFEFRKRYL